MSLAPAWHIIRHLFHEAIQRPAAERRRYLDQHCGGDVILRQELESLLLAHENANGFLDDAPAPVLRRFMTGSPLAPGVRLGRFEILATLGAGGMGDVYRARDTRLGREVAVKLLPPGLAADPDRRAVSNASHACSRP